MLTFTMSSFPAGFRLALPGWTPAASQLLKQVLGTLCLHYHRSFSHAHFERSQPIIIDPDLMQAWVYFRIINKEIYRPILLNRYRTLIKNITVAALYFINKNWSSGTGQYYWLRRQ